jgi:4-oxalocrotonate tautomerase
VLERSRFTVPGRGSDLAGRPVQERRRKFMPLIQIKVFKGVLSEEKKQEMIERVTEVVAEIEARPYPMEKLRPYTWCVIEEVPAQNWGIGGQPSNLELLKALLESD